MPPPRGRAHVPKRAHLYDHPTYRTALESLRMRLRDLRREKRWTMEEAADRCGLLYQNYQAIEAGKVNVTLLTLARLADGFGSDVAWLVLSEAFSGVLAERIVAELLERDERLARFRRGESGVRTSTRTGPAKRRRR